ncbi:hypothetical protein Scep_009388 [Stephania cephalantha]|uniref:Uncharacterized protein n=1 Tax=Stephania cephalantha TaxID=152367 RepID=A0AAP0JT73_9MAGN
MAALRRGFGRASKDDELWSARHQQANGRSTQQWRTNKYRRSLVDEELTDNELGGAAGMDGQQEMEDSTLARSSGFEKEGRQTSDSRMATQRTTKLNSSGVAREEKDVLAPKVVGKM